MKTRAKITKSSVQRLERLIRAYRAKAIEDYTGFYTSQINEIKRVLMPTWSREYEERKRLAGDRFMHSMT